MKNISYNYMLITEKSNMFFKPTAKGEDLLKILLAIEEFKKKYPKRSSENFELVGIYDDKFIRKILRHYLKR